MSKSKKYSWNIHTIENKIKELELKLIREKDSNRRELIKEDLEMLQSYVYEHYESLKQYPTPPLLDFYREGRDFTRVINFLYDDFFEFRHETENNLSSIYIKGPKEKSLKRQDMLDLTYDFYRTLPSPFINKFRKEFSRERRQLFLENNSCTNVRGETICLESSKTSYIRIFKTDTIFDILSLIHEYSHAISHNINPAHFHYFKSLFVEIDALFMELIASDFLKDKTNLTDYLKARYLMHEGYTASSINLTDLYPLYLEEKTIPGGFKTNKELKQTAENACGINGFELEELLTSPDEFQEHYLISYIIAIELYEIYKEDKDKAFELLRRIILLSDNTPEGFYNEIKNLGINPNQHIRKYNNELVGDIGRIRTLKKNC